MEPRHLHKNLVALGIIVVILALVSLIASFIAKRYEYRNIQEVNPISLEIPQTPPSTSIKPPLPPPIPSEIQEDVFTAAPRPANVGNVVGYFAGGEFVTYVPDWLVEHWGWDSKNDPHLQILSPRDSISNRDFSDIMIRISPTTETNNAETHYNVYHRIGFDESDGISTETLLNHDGTTRIYHVQIISNGEFSDIYYLDGRRMTAEIEFTGSMANYAKYSTKVKEFVKGLGAGIGPRG